MPRTIWKGSISFGLVNIPVNLYTASRDREIKFKMLHKKDLSEIRYARICKSEEKEIPWKDIVKGYENEKGQFVVFEEEDLKKASAEVSKVIEIVAFIDEDEIDSLYYVKPYYLEPEKNASGPYALLRDALKKSKKVALAKFTLHQREHLAVLKTFENVIILNALRYQSELISHENLKLPAAKKASDKELQMALQLIDQLTDSFQPEKYTDTYVEDLKKIIKHKKKMTPKKEKAPTKVHDIMSLLKQSLEKNHDAKRVHKKAKSH